MSRGDDEKDDDLFEGSERDELPIDDDDEKESDDDDGEEEEEEAPEPARIPVPVERPSNRARRNERSRQRMEERTRLIVAEQMAREREANQQAESERLRLILSETRRQPETPQKDPLEENIRYSTIAQRAIVAEWEALPEETRKNPEKVAEWREKLAEEVQRTEDFKYQLRRNQERAQEERNQRSQPQTPPQQTAFILHMRGKYPDVYADQKAVQFAQAKWLEAGAEGKRQDPALFEKCLQDAQVKILGKPAQRATSGGKPNANERARFTGTSRGAGEGGSSSGGAPSVTKDEAKIAVAMYPSLPRPKAIAKWYKVVKMGKDD